MHAITVIIPTLGRPDLLERCVDSITRQLRAGDECLIGIDIGDDDSARVVAAEPLATAIFVKPSGVISKINTLIAAAKSEIIAFTDDDAEVNAEWIETIRAAFVNDLRLGAFGGRDIIPRLAQAPSSSRVGVIGFSGRMHGNHHLGSGAPREVDFLKGVNMAVRKELLPLDHRLAFEGAEPSYEIEVCLRGLRQGWRVVYDPGHTVTHHAAARPGLARDDRLLLARLSARNSYIAANAAPMHKRVRIHFYNVLVGGSPTYGITRFIIAIIRREPSPLTMALLAQRGRRDGRALIRNSAHRWSLSRPHLH